MANFSLSVRLKNASLRNGLAVGVLFLRRDFISKTKSYWSYRRPSDDLCGHLILSPCFLDKFSHALKSLRHFFFRYVTTAFAFNPGFQIKMTGTAFIET